MNKRLCQYPICFTWSDQENDQQRNFLNKIPRVSSTSPIGEILAESEFKCVYDRDKNDKAEIYISCNVLEKTFHLGVNLDDTVRHVKNHIKRLEKIPTALFHLFFNGTVIKDGKTLEECGVTNKSTLTLGIRLHTACCDQCKKVSAATDGKPVKLILDNLKGNPYDVTLSLLTPVENLKQLIEEKYKVYPDHQLVMYNGKTLEDDVILADYGILGNTNLYLILYQFDKCSFCSGCAKAAGKPVIHLKFLNNKVTCVLNPESTIRKLKETSYQYLRHIHPDLQQIMFKRQQLPDDKTLQECGIQDGSKLKVKLHFSQKKCDTCNGPLC